MTLDPDTLPEQLEHLGLLRFSPSRRLLFTRRFVLRFRARRTGESVSFRAEGIREFRIMNRDLTEADGYLTPSQKATCRAKILQDFSPRSWRTKNEGYNPDKVITVWRTRLNTHLN